MNKKSVTVEESALKRNSICIMKGDLIAIIFSLIVLTIFAILLTYTNIPESTITPVILTITGVSILIGSTISTRKIKKNGLLYGGIIGLIYIILLYIASSISISGFSISGGSLTMLAVGTITGIVGGIIGVNLNRK